MKETYRERRAFLFPRLKQLGFELPAWPEGAFYIYAGIEKWQMDSMEFVERALVEAKVAITPGYDFGAHRAGSHVRFSFANSWKTSKKGASGSKRGLAASDLLVSSLCALLRKRRTIVLTYL